MHSSEVGCKLGLAITVFRSRDVESVVLKRNSAQTIVRAGDGEDESN